MRLRDRISSGIRAVFHNLLSPDTDVPEADRLAATVEVAQARLAMLQAQIVDVRARAQEVETAWQQAQERLTEVQKRLQTALSVGRTAEAETLQAEVAQMQSLAQELGLHARRQRQLAAEMEADMRALQQRIDRGRQRLAQLASTAAAAPAPAGAGRESAPAAAAAPAQTTAPPDLAARIQRLALNEPPPAPSPPAAPATDSDQKKNPA